MENSQYTEESKAQGSMVHSEKKSESSKKEESSPIHETPTVRKSRTSDRKNESFEVKVISPFSDAEEEKDTS